MKRNTETTRFPTAGGRRVARRVCGSVLLTLVLLAASCSDGDPGEGLSADDTADSQVATTTADTNNDGDGSGAAGDDDGTGTIETDAGDTADSSDEAAGDSNGGVEVILDGGCTLDEAGSQDFYAVVEISDDDPDGGLNVRSDYPAGEKIVTLPEGSVVFIDNCAKADDGSVWFGVVTDEGRAGWASAAFLTTDLPPDPELGAVETEELVVDLLDAMATRRWDDAAALLTFSDGSIGIYDPLLGPPGDGADRPTLAEQLEQYCEVRVCDAPYEVNAVHGSYMPLLVRPQVEVTFTYSDGFAGQIFSWSIGPGDEFTVDSLPGQSVLAFNSTRPTVADLVTNTDEVPDGLLEAAETVRQGLLSETGDRIPAGYIPAEGVAVSANGYIEPDPSNRQIVTEADLAGGSDDERLWGYSDGVGEPILSSVEERFATYRRQSALLDPDAVGVDTRVGVGTTIDNLAELFPNGHVVEFHRESRGQFAGFNWLSTRMVLELRDDQWVVVAIVEDFWTT